MPRPSPSIEWVQEWLSPVRWQRYLDACTGDPAKALELYEWNVQLSGAVMHDIAHFEVALRNIYNRAITNNWDGEHHWLFDGTSPVNEQLFTDNRLDEVVRASTAITELALMLLPPLADYIQATSTIGRIVEIDPR